MEKCLVCNKELGNVNTMHLQTHNLTKEQYMKRYYPVEERAENNVVAKFDMVKSNALILKSINESNRLLLAKADKLNRMILSDANFVNEQMLNNRK